VIGLAVNEHASHEIDLACFQRIFDHVKHLVKELVQPFTLWREQLSNKKPRAGRVRFSAGPLDTPSCCVAAATLMPASGQIASRRLGLWRESTVGPFEKSADYGGLSFLVSRAPEHRDSVLEQLHVGAGGSRSQDF
jgi:hypothetical protein